MASLDSRGYKPEQQYYKHPPAKPTQPHSHTLDIAVHPNLAVAQLGLTPEEIEEVFKGQEESMREEEQ